MIDIYLAYLSKIPCQILLSLDNPDPDALMSNIFHRLRQLSLIPGSSTPSGARIKAAALMVLFWL